MHFVLGNPSTLRRFKMLDASVVHCSRCTIFYYMTTQKYMYSKVNKYLGSFQLGY